ncbi:ABC transporter ATP-binding protein [Staphylococcus caprae]|uniref:ABC transporter ATP-binding protein n=2 Tax=Staphylococcus TaxID=1279 RepID=A0ABN5W6V7_9STAP|nr:ABC transporter ATP-binding protein [Staphylococcus caprae]EES41292.1 ABC transporter, ATP-binding protein [Staphylococcus caprae M23864:W1]MBX5317284.1 ABC transporter ATP-binding protein [Staphylococcus caprae]MBX5323731.1 ABC transporter ATP-binding protein [Staphylococcus caprae]MDI0015210.1 ABC transporter ATP-binding protein [Staphylococcus caprae]MEB8095514.1 ABC transporter ATP-binding protein [Staphylococcus caprae]
MEKLLEINHLNKSYNQSEFHLSNISFSIKPGEVVGLIGKNGSGKSTLINTIVGNRHKDNGKISFFDEEVDEEDNTYKEHIGVVFDDLRVPNKLTLTSVDKVFANIYRTWNSEEFFSLIKEFELPTQNKVNTFSRGMRMKTALSIAMAHDSKLLILDEATAGMDVSGREQVIEILEDYTNEGNGILISSHISEDIEQLANKLVFMRDGEIILKENKEELLKNYGIVEQPVESFNICNEYLVASRERNHNRISLVNNYQEVPGAKQINNIDDATKIVMRGDK